MKKQYSFGDRFEYRWPDISELERYYQQETSGTNESGCSFKIDGLWHTSHMLEGKDRVNAKLFAYFHPRLGAFVMHTVWDGRSRTRTTHYTRGDLGKRIDFHVTHDGDLRSKALFISAVAAWPAIRDFVKNDGALSPEVAWVNESDLPADTFPEPQPPDPSKWKLRQ